MHTPTLWAHSTSIDTRHSGSTTTNLPWHNARKIHSIMALYQWEVKPSHLSNTWMFDSQDLHSDVTAIYYLASTSASNTTMVCRPHLLRAHRWIYEIYKMDTITVESLPPGPFAFFHYLPLKSHYCWLREVELHPAIIPSSETMMNVS